MLLDAFPVNQPTASKHWIKASLQTNRSRQWNRRTVLLRSPLLISPDFTCVNCNCPPSSDTLQVHTMYINVLTGHSGPLDQLFALDHWVTPSDPLTRSVPIVLHAVWPVIGMIMLSVLRPSVTLCIVAKRYNLPQKWTGTALYRNKHDFTTFNPIHRSYPLQFKTCCTAQVAATCE